MKNEDILLTEVSVKTGFGYERKLLPIKEYFQKCHKHLSVKKGKFGLIRCNLSSAILDQDTLSMVGGHKFKFNFKLDKVGILDLFKRQVMVYIINIEDRYFVFNYHLSSMENLVEIEITHLIQPKMKRVDFLRKAIKEDIGYYHALRSELFEIYEKASNKFKLFEIDVDKLDDCYSIVNNYIDPNISDYDNVVNLHVKHGKDAAKFMVNLHIGWLARRDLVILHPKDDKIHECIKNLEDAIKDAYKINKLYNLVLRLNGESK